MSIWNKVLLGLLFFCSALLFYFAVQSLSSRTAWQKQIEKLESDIAKTNDDNRLLEYGIKTTDESVPVSKTPPKLNEGSFSIEEYEAFVQKNTYALGSKESLIHLRNDVDHLIRDRDARTWFECTPTTVNVSENEVIVQVLPATDVPAIQPKTVVYVFDKRPLDQGGSFIGAFFFDEAKQNAVILKNSYLMTDLEKQRLQQSKSNNATWVVYTKLPGDSQGYFVSGMHQSDAEGKVVASDGSLADVDPNFLHSATDFLLLVTDRIKKQQYVDSLNIRLGKINNAIEQSNLHKGYYEMVIQRTTDELTEMTRQRDEAAGERDQLKITVDNLEKEIVAIKTDNKRIVAELTETQLVSSEIIHNQNAQALVKAE